MAVIRNVALWMLSLIGIAAAAEGSVAPLTSGMVYQTGRVIGRTIAGKDRASSTPREMSNAELQRLHAWFDAHQSGLHMILSSPPVPSTSVEISDIKGQRIKLDLYSVNESWSHALQVTIWDEHGKFVYGGELSIPRADMVDLRAILELPT